MLQDAVESRQLNFAGRLHFSGKVPALRRATSGRVGGTFRRRSTCFRPCVSIRRRNVWRRFVANVSMATEN